MKLVDILARELKDWPEGCDELFQTSSGRVIGVSNRDTDKSEKIGMLTLNDEGTDPYVTSAEWQAAVDALNAEQVSELKWPDGATHYVPPQNGAENGVFYKVANDLAVKSWIPENGGFAHYDRPPVTNKRHHLPGTITRQNERALEWDGEGLPPVGTVCEFTSDGGGSYEKCEVIAHHNSLIVCFIHQDKIRATSGCCVRPIKTAEQIAAEKREAEISKMLDIINAAAAGGSGKSAARALYDAGYHKQ